MPIVRQVFLELSGLVVGLIIGSIIVLYFLPSLEPLNLFALGFGNFSGFIFGRYGKGFFNAS